MYTYRQEFTGVQFHKLYATELNCCSCYEIQCNTKGLYCGNLFKRDSIQKCCSKLRVGPRCFSSFKINTALVNKFRTGCLLNRRQRTRRAYSEETVDYTVARTKESSRKSLLLQYGIVTDFVKCSREVQPLLPHFRDRII